MCINLLIKSSLYNKPSFLEFTYGTYQFNLDKFLENHQLYNDSKENMKILRVE